MTVRQRYVKIILKWLCYTILFVLCATLQTTPGFLTIGNVKPILLLPVCLGIAVCEGEYAGAIFGAIGGLVWDMLAGRVMGFFAVGVMLCCFGASIATQLYLKENGTNFLLLTVASSFLITGCDFLFGYIMPGYSEPLAYYCSVILPLLVFTCAISPLIFYFVKKIFDYFKIEE